MTKMTKNAATKMATDLNTAGNSYSAILTTIRTLGYEKPAELLAELKIEKGKKVGIMEAMYDYLAESPRSEAELKQWIEENGSENTMRWIKSHDKVRQLVNRVMEKSAK